MNFRGKVKAIVSEAGIKKLTRQLHSRPRNISRAVDRLKQRDYRRTSGKARSGDREAIEQLAQMHKQRTTKPVKLPVKLPVLKKVKGEFRELSPKTKAYIKKVKAELNLSHTEIPFREKVKDLLETGRQADAVHMYHPDSREKGTAHPTKATIIVPRGSKHHKQALDGGFVEMPESQKPESQKPESQTESSSFPTAARRGRDERIEHYKQRLAFWRDAQRQDAYNKAKARWDRSQTTNEDSNHPFYQKVKELSRARGRKSQSLVDSTNGNGKKSNGNGAAHKEGDFTSPMGEKLQNMTPAQRLAHARKTRPQTAQDRKTQADADKQEGRFPIRRRRSP